MLLKNFREDLIALSKDAVVNTRLELALAFSRLHAKYEEVEQEAFKRQKKIEKKKGSNEDEKYVNHFSKLQGELGRYLSFDFIECLRNLKGDNQKCIREQLSAFDILPAPVAKK